MEFLVYLGIIPEVPLGFEREAAIQMTEINRDDEQLAADIAAAETAAAAMEIANGAAVPAAAQEPAAMDGTSDQAVLEAAGEGDIAAEPVGAADVDMADAQGSAEPAAEPGAEPAAEPAAEVVAEALAAAANLESASNPQVAATAAEQATATGPAVASEPSGKAADGDTAVSTHSMADDSDTESDIIMDQSGYGRAVSDASHDGLHAKQNVNAHASASVPLPELSAASANGSRTSASVTPHSDAQMSQGLDILVPLAGSKASGVAKSLQGTEQTPTAAVAKSQSHKVVVSVGGGSGAVMGLDDPNIIDLCDGDDTPQLEANGHAPMLEPKQEEQEAFQSGYLQQSGYGDIELNSLDSEESDSADNPEEISIAEQEEEQRDARLPPSSSCPGHPMDTNPSLDNTLVTDTTAGAGTTASGLADGAALADASGLNGTDPGLNGTALVQPSGEPVKIKIEAGLGKEAAGGADQNQIQMDAMAFLAMEDDDSEDDLPQARPHRGQVCSMISCNVIICCAVACSFIVCSVIICSAVACSLIICSVIICSAPVGLAQSVWFFAVCLASVWDAILVDNSALSVLRHCEWQSSCALLRDNTLHVTVYVLSWCCISSSNI